MVAADAVIVEQFLHRDADRRAAAPDADEMGRREAAAEHLPPEPQRIGEQLVGADEDLRIVAHAGGCNRAGGGGRSEEHTSELQSLMRISYAVFCLKKKKKTATKQD